MKDFITRIVRTVAPYIWAFIALRAVEWFGITFSESESAAVIQAVEVLLGVVIYAIVAAFSEKYPWLERILIIPVRPVYKKTG